MRVTGTRVRIGVFSLCPELNVMTRQGRSQRRETACVIEANDTQTAQAQSMETRAVGLQEFFGDLSISLRRRCLRAAHWRVAIALRREPPIRARTTAAWRTTSEHRLWWLTGPHTDSHERLRRVLSPPPRERPRSCQ